MNKPEDTDIVKNVKKLQSLLDEQTDLYNSQIRFLSEHKFKKELEYIDLKRKIVNEIRLELRSIIENGTVPTKLYID